MVLLTINAPSNDYTVYFDQPIPKPNYIRLLNCSLYNSWYNLKRMGEITIYSKSKTIKFYPGHYTLKSFADGLVTIEMNTFRGIYIKTEKGESMSLNHNLASFLGIPTDGLKIKRQAYAEAEAAFQKKLQSLVTTSN